MKKILIICIVLLTMFSCKNSHNEILFLGNEFQDIDYIDYLKTEKNIDIEDAFIMKEGYISYLYTFIIKDAKKDDISLKDKIKKAKQIYINIGYYDLMRMFTLNENKEHVLDEDVFIIQEELFTYYFFLILEEIRELTSTKIVIFSPYITSYISINDKIELENGLSRLYLGYEEVTSYFSCSLIDIRDVSLIKNNNDIRAEYIYNKVNHGT